ncbi:hypothetical protein, partial [Robiginitalea sp.]|uniref:hypothetical protein n=1 Tax=Robiginitalea sp. TaxID=1902411 RepID=UPI003C77D696
LLSRKLNIPNGPYETGAPPEIWTYSEKIKNPCNPQGTNEPSEIDDLNFSPDQDFNSLGKGHSDKDLHPESENGYYRFLNYLKGTKNDTDA